MIRYGNHKATSLTPDELRLHACYALACCITSHYWFDFSLKSLVRFPYPFKPATRMGREIRTLPIFARLSVGSYRP